MPKLTAEDAGKYYDLGKARIPEAFNAFYALAASRGESLQLRGGCKGLEDELATSRTDEIMHRACMHRLRELVQSRRKPQIYLDGPVSSGKSLALAALVDWARAEGWLVMYLPAATSLLHGGLFKRRAPAVGECLLLGTVAVCWSNVEVSARQ